MLIYIILTYVSVRTMHLDQRPYMIVKEPTYIGSFAADTDLYARVKAINVGKTAALEKFDIATLAHFPHQTGDQDSQQQAMKQFLDEIFSRMETTAQADHNNMSWVPWIEDAAPGIDYFLQNGIPLKLTKTEFDDVTAPDNAHNNGAVFFAGIIHYGDIFGASHKTEFCWYSIVKETSTWVRCHAHNTIR